jgi:hypothetical protein
MDYLRRSLSGLSALSEPEPLGEAARARLEVLRGLLRSPVVVGDDEYEGLLARVYEMAMALVARDADEGDAASPNHRDAASAAGWEALGFQAAAPDREFRGGGMLGLHCLVYALEHHAGACRALLRGPFPFAAASINMTLVAARLAGVVEEGADDDVAADPFLAGADPDNYAAERARRRALKSTAARCAPLLGAAHEGFFELHCAALEAATKTTPSEAGFDDIFSEPP